MINSSSVFSSTLGIPLGPVSITRFPLRRFSPGAGLLRSRLFHRQWLRFSRGWVRKDGNLLKETGCIHNGTVISSIVSISSMIRILIFMVMLRECSFYVWLVIRRIPLGLPYGVAVDEGARHLYVADALGHAVPYIYI